MAGEMSWIDPVTGETGDGEVYSLHAAIARELHGIVKPFDVYQGPYVLIGSEFRDSGVYAPLVDRQAVRLWIGEIDGSTRVYREDTDTWSDPFWPYGSGAEIEAVEAARSLFP